MSQGNINAGKHAGAFQKNDQRINKAGNLNAAAQSYKIIARNAMADGIPPKELVAIIIKAARAGEQWAIQIIIEQMGMKVKDELEHSGEVKAIMRFEYGNGKAE